MRFKIIGSAAGGGFPQWNCNYHLSRAARQAGVARRTQSSLAASGDGLNWVLFNASPDINQQIADTAELQPAAGAPLRSSPIRAVVLTNADVDHIAGLLSLRERQPFSLYATKEVLETISANRIFEVLDPAIVPRRLLPLTGEIAVCDAEGQEIGVMIQCFPVRGKVALFLEDTSSPQADFSSEAGDTIGVRIRAEGSGKALFYIPACAGIEAGLRDRLVNAACLLFDGTVFTDDELITAGVGQKTGSRMGHIAMTGDNGSLAALADLPIKRRIFVHINNTNPVLDDKSAEHRFVREAGWEIAQDGMEIEL